MKGGINMEYALNLPSWTLIKDKLIATIGQDPNVCIGGIAHVECDEYCIPINIRGRAKADAMRKIVPCEYKYGNITVKIQIYECGCKVEECCGGGSARDIANTICIALQGNYLFEATALPDKGFKGICPKVYALIAPKYIRLWGNGGCVTFQELAPNLFAEVLKTTYFGIIPVKVLFTSRHQCQLCPEDIYCMNSCNRRLC